jgi:Zn finger protein HypA/HybF involved in hydrogenase expression
MHEIAIARNIIKQAQKQGKVQSITIEVGEVAHLTTAELEPILKSLVDWEINLQEIKAQAKCQCGFSGSPRILARGHDSCLYECPICGKVPEIVVGGDIKLVKVKGEVS